MTETCPCGASVALASHDPYSLVEDFRTAHRGCWNETRISNHFDSIRELTAERDRYREWWIQLRAAADEVRGFWGVETDEGFRDAMNHLASVLDSTLIIKAHHGPL